MNFYQASIGQLVIVNLFVFYIWFKVLAWTIHNKPPNPQYTKLLTTSVGLVITSAVLVGLMLIRAFQLYGYDLDIYILICYAVLALGNLMFIVSASIGTAWVQFKVFLTISLIWNVAFIISNIVGK